MPVSKAEKHSKAETGVQPQNSASPNSGALAYGIIIIHGFPDAKAVMSTERSEWRHLEAVVKARRILSHKDFLGLECKSPAMRKPARSLHAPDGLVGMTGFGT